MSNLMRNQLSHTVGILHTVGFIMCKNIKQLFPRSL